MFGLSRQGPHIPKTLKKGVDWERACRGPLPRVVYCLYVGNRREKSVRRRIEKAQVRREYPIRVVSELPGYLTVEADVPESILNLIFRGCGVRRVCGQM